MEKKKMSWKDVTLKQFMELQELLKIEDETDRLLAVAELLLGEEVVDLPIAEFTKRVREIDFIKNPLPDEAPQKKIEVNGRKYNVDCLLGNIKTGQYIDYINHGNSGDFAKMLSVFLIPEGHKYNDGYDMEEVFSDINDLPITFVNSAAFFFARQFKTFIQIFQRYSIKQLKKMKIDKQTKKSMIEVLDKSMDMALSRLS